MAQLQLLFFGAPRAERDGQPLQIRRRKGMALLAYLALTGRTHSREALATLLWPELDHSRGLSNLRRELSRLKKDLGVDIFLADRSQLGLDFEKEWRVDVERFRALLATVDEHAHFPAEACDDCLVALNEATALYADDLLAGFTLPDAPAFDEWHFFENESLRQALGDALQKLIEWYREQKAYREAVKFARRWLALDPLHEPAHRLLMAVYARDGQQAAALRQYEECVRLLEEELAVEPEAATEELYEAIRSRQFPPERPEQLLVEIEASAPATAERYVIEEKLPAGGQGEIFRARDTLTGEPVIIKRLRPGMRTDQERVARFAREGEALRRLNHPNIVRMLATFEQEGQHSIVMEYVPGGTLRELLDDEGPLSPEQGVAIALELADALSRAHHLGIIHRDLKPENVLLAADGTPRLTDFGVAGMADVDERLTQTGTLLGSPAYMSPEALRGERLTAQSDIWSFGVLLFELLSGRRPFAGEKITEVVVNILQQPAPDPAALRPELPPALAELIKRMLAKEPAARVASMRQVGSVLEAIRAGRADSLAIDWMGAAGVWEAGSGEARPEPASELPVSTPHNLPQPVTRFVGRDEERARIRQLLAEDPTCRLVTLIGPGGIGKSRLAVEVGRAMLSHYPDGVYFVPLAGVSSAEYIVPAVARALEFNFSGATTPRAQLLNYLRPRKCLLIMDNFEHLLDGATLLADFLRFAPDLDILATSRARLMLGEEWGYELGGLSYPDPAAPALAGADWERFSAMRLFVQQARRAQASFAVADEDLPSIAAVCRLLEGMPLALELAAPWVRAISVAELVSEIERSFDFLSASTVPVPVEERHHSLRAIFIQTWSTLADDEKRVLKRLSVFKGGFSREAAAAIVNATLPDLARLLDRALLRRGSNGRYSLHELIRQFAAERLEAVAEEAETARARHSDYYLSFLAERTPPIKGGRQQAVLAEIASEIDNVRAAWAHGVARRQIVSIFRAAECYWLYSEFRGDLSGGEELFGRSLEALSDPAPTSVEEKRLLAFLQAGRGSLAARRGWLGEGIEQMKAGIAQLREVEHPDRQKEAFALAWLAFGLVMQGHNDEATRAAQSSLDLFPVTNDYWLKAGCLRLLGAAALHRGELDRAEAYLQECLETCAEIDERRIQTYARMNLGRIDMLRGEHHRAGQWFHEARQLSRQLNDRVGYADLLNDQGLLALGQGNFDEATAHFEESLTVAEEIGSSRTGATKTYLGIVALQQGEIEKATKLLRDGLAAARAVGHPAEVAQALHQLGVVAGLQGKTNQAEQYLQEALAIWQKAGNEPRLAAVWRSLAEITGNSAEARNAYRKALQLARQHGLAPVALDVFAGVAPLLLSSGQAQQAARLLALAARHPAASQMTRSAARRQLADLAGGHTVPAEESGQLPDWHELAAELLPELQTVAQA